MFAMFAQLFAMFTSLFSAGAVGASALEDYAGAAKVHSHGFKKRVEAKEGIELQDLLVELEAKRAQPKVLPAPKQEEELAL